MPVSRGRCVRFRAKGWRAAVASSVDLPQSFGMGSRGLLAAADQLVGRMGRSSKAREGSERCSEAKVAQTFQQPDRRS